MNYSDDLKIVWWGIGACGSGTMADFLRDYYNLVDNGRNTSGIPEDKKDYTIVTNVRNPYAWELSTYFDVSEGNDTTFEEFLEQGGYCTQQPLIADYYIRCEDMYSEIQKVPNIKFGPLFQSEAKERLSNPKYQRSRPFITKTMLRDYWNQELVDKYSERYAELFKVTGYNKDSWKTGIHWEGFNELRL